MSAHEKVTDLMTALDQSVKDARAARKRHGEAMECGRLLIRNGRAWLTLSDEDIERGARAVVTDPRYREEIVHSAILHAHETADATLTQAVCDAANYLHHFGGAD